MPTLTALVRLPLVYLSAALAIGAAPQGGVQKPPPPPLQAPPQRPAAPAPSTPRTGAPPPPAAQTADAWLSGIMQSTGTTRAALLQSLGKVRVAYRPGRVSTIIPPAEASAIIAAEARKIGLEVVASAPATLVVELQRGKGYEVSLSGRLGSASSNVFEISAQAWIQVDADVLREDGYHRGPVAIASAFLGTLDRGDDITRETCERLLQGVVPLLPRDAALRDEIVPDAEWAALIQTQRPQAQSLYAPLLHAPRRTMDAPGALAGITRVARTDVGLSPFNELFYMNLIENFFGFGRMWQPEPVWTAALNSASVIVGSARIVPRYLPIVTYRVSGGAIATNELGGREQTLVGAMGEAALVERNCLVATPAGVARINCRSWLSSRMASGFHTGGEQHVVTQLEAAMKDQAAALGIELAWSGANPRAAASTAMLLPAAANTPRTAYDEINAGKPRAQHQPLLYVDGARRTYIAGLTADGATFRILEVPVDNIKRRLPTSKRRSRAITASPTRPARTSSWP